MKTSNSQQLREIAETGTPLDYSEALYRVYFEVVDPCGDAKKIIADFVGPENAEKMVVLPHGYETISAIQNVPEIVRLLSKANIAVYQAVRYEKL